MYNNYNLGWIWWENVVFFASVWAKSMHHFLLVDNKLPYLLETNVFFVDMVPFTVFSNSKVY